MIYLAQTDTTVGFLSKEQKLLNIVKKRPLDKSCIFCSTSFKGIVARVPNEHKKFVRRAKKTTFILPNSFSFRFVKEGAHVIFLRKTGALYSTSANLTGQSFDIDFAKQKADIIVEDSRGFFESKPSIIIKIGKKKLKKIR
ncbi:MAG: Sua5 YciO YrdC YwlC family protein [Campylobacteraceae bacterium]|jgi:tRNA A37 threonylcarbamoyladenosine synthetase subunit TsaC/SUA5/YrdC|nr:Sua5 YciO YrdC YwlC family protein [Campylobacteraceae bacterium]